MKKYSLYKTIQLVLLILLVVAVLFYIFPNDSAFHAVANDPTTRLLGAALWGVLVFNFLFILLDYAFFFNCKREYKEMELAANSDPVSGIANRFSCDVLIEKYIGKDLPDNIGAIMISISNIQEVNRIYGHLQGDLAIRDFSNILRISSSDLCFVGRNGGNKFLAIFEDGSDEKMALFLGRVKQRVNIHNNNMDNTPIAYGYGMAFSGDGDSKDITSLIALANSRLNEKGQ